MRAVGQRYMAALLSAFIVAVPRADAAHKIDVMCTSSIHEATLTISGLSASYQCFNTEMQQVEIDVSYFLVNIGVKELQLELESSSVERINFVSSGTEESTLTPSELDFSPFKKLKSLSFTKVVMDSVELIIQNVTSDIHFINSRITDLSLPLHGEALRVIDLNGTSVDTLPKFLYERELRNNMDIIVDLSSVNGEIELSAKELNVLETNVQAFSTQSWTQEYKSGCDTKGGNLDMMVLPGSDKNTVFCGSRDPLNAGASTPTSDNSPVADMSQFKTQQVERSGSDDSSSGISTGALVAIIAIVIVVAAVLVLFSLRAYFRRKAANANSQNNEASATLMNKGDGVDKGSFVSNDEFLRDFRLPQSDVTLIKSMGTGRLWLGEYNGGKVVTKRVESEVTDSHVTKALMAQARTFATISHPNITNLVGVTWMAGTDFAVVTEFMDKGNLKTVLANTDVNLDVHMKLQMCSDVALALAYLHDTDQNLCAKQLSSHKVLVNKAMKCKLNLFECIPSSAKLGTSSTANTYSYGMGEVAWLPPEVITRSSPLDARKINIYAFGVLISEIFTRGSPYQSLVEEMGNTMSDVEIVKRVRRHEPIAPHENRQEYLAAPAIVRQLVEQCLSYAPMSRPAAKEMVEALHCAKNEFATGLI